MQKEIYNQSWNDRSRIFGRCGNGEKKNICKKMLKEKLLREERRERWAKILISLIDSCILEV
jgi:hypothetical protein